jgi:RNA polymerase sigma-70 factor (ECF subfamily)
MSHAKPPTGKTAPRQLDRSSFAAQFQNAYSRLWTLAAGIIGDRAAADDIVQDSAIAALSKLDQFQPGSNFQAWLGRFVRWHAFNYSRKKSARGTMATDPHLLDMASAQPEQPVVDWESDVMGQISQDQPHFDDEVVHALRSVSTVGRACMLLRTIHQMSYREIAQLLDIPEGTAMSHVHRTRQLMRDRLRGYRGNPHSESEPQ